jgi:membrane protein YdbS with pleckstrin-like domain
MSGNRRPPGVWLDRFMRAVLPLGVVYAVLVAIEIYARATDTQAVSGAAVLVTIVHVAIAVVLIWNGILWRRRRDDGAG